MPPVPRLTVAALLFAAAVVSPSLAVPADSPLSADQIMARVATNQDKTEAARQHYIYLQHIRMVSRRPGGRVMCEEVTDSRVSPQQKDSHQQLLALDGRYWLKGQYVRYTTLPKASDDNNVKVEHGSAGINIDTEPGMDRDLVENLRHNLSDDQSKDGLGHGLFPLTTGQQAHYNFQLLGRQAMNGHDVYRVRFVPKDKEEFDWKGEAFIDTREFEPVVVFTQMSRKLPLAVRTLLGTNLPGLGFSVTYEQQPGGIWFPVSFGTEFRMRVLFFLSRDISMSLANTHFEQTHTDARILDDVKLAGAPDPAPTAIVH